MRTINDIQPCLKDRLTLCAYKWKQPLRTAAFINLLVHEYEKIDLQRLYQAAKKKNRRPDGISFISVQQARNDVKMF
jgi:hypothetical protein